MNVFSSSFSLLVCLFLFFIFFDHSPYENQKNPSFVTGFQFISVGSPLYKSRTPILARLIRISFPPAFKLFKLTRIKQFQYSYSRLYLKSNEKDKGEDPSSTAISSGPISSLEDAFDDDDTIKYLEKSFETVAIGNKVTFEQLCHWEEMENLLRDEYLTRKELKKIFLNYVDNLMEGLTVEDFIALNKEVNDYLLEKEEEEREREEGGKGEEEEEVEEEQEEEQKVSMALDKQGDEETTKEETKKVFQTMFGGTTLIKTNEEIRTATQIIESEVKHDNNNKEAIQSTDSKEKQVDKEETQEEESEFEEPEDLFEIREKSDWDDDDDTYNDDYTSHQEYEQKVKQAKLRGYQKMFRTETQELAANTAAMANVAAAADEDNKAMEECWSTDLKIHKKFTKSDLIRLKLLYLDYTGDKTYNLLSYIPFSWMPDIREIIQSNNIGVETLKKFWIEAVDFEQNLYGADYIPGMSSAYANFTDIATTALEELLTTSAANIKAESDEATSDTIFNLNDMMKEKENEDLVMDEIPLDRLYKRQKKTARTFMLINFDTFLRLYWKVIHLKHTVDGLWNNMIYHEKNLPFIKEYKRITADREVLQTPGQNEEPVITFSDFFDWEYIGHIAKHLGNQRQRKIFLRYLAHLWRKKLSKKTQLVTIPYEIYERKLKEREEMKNSKEYRAELRRRRKIREIIREVNGPQPTLETAVQLNKPRDNSLPANYTRKPLVKVLRLTGIDKLQFLFLCNELEKFTG